MPIKVTPDLVQSYAQKKLKHRAYDDTVDLYESLRVHADGDMPKDVIEERRPSESDRIKEYREKIYVPITESTVSKVITSLSKIRRSQDWSIDYDPKKVPGIIGGNEKETLQYYCEKGYPYFTSVTSWAFSVLLRNQELDANAVEVIWPINMDRLAQNEYYKPFAYIYNSPQVLDFVMDDYAVLLSTDCYAYNDSKNNYRTDGKIIYIVDTVSVQKWVQVDFDGRMSLQFNWPHGLGFAPFRKLGGVFYRALEDSFIYKSRIQSMTPHLNEAARIYSDLQAEIVQHVHSDKWIYSQTECRQCNGTGSAEDHRGDACACKSCNGVGYIPTSPYTNMVLRPPNNVEGQAPIPTPPAGYIQKADVALMVDKIKIIVNEHLKEALASINMEFLSKAPLNESGVAKEVDKDELNNFVHSVAEDLVSVIDWTYYVINEYRYKDIITNPEKRRAMLPAIPVPEKFDLLSSTLLLDDIAKANTNKLNPVILNEMQIEYAAKKFYNDSRVKNELETIFELDPFPNITEDEKMTRLSNQGITLVDYVISSNIQQFVRRAMQEDEKFNSMTMVERRSVIEKYAEEVIEANLDKKSMRPKEVEEEEEDIIEEPVIEEQ